VLLKSDIQNVCKVEVEGVGGKAPHGFVLNNFALGTQFLNRWIELLYLIFPNSSTGYKTHRIPKKVPQIDFTYYPSYQSRI